MWSSRQPTPSVPARFYRCTSLWMRIRMCNDPH
jgi:hypothetical protein